MSYFGRIRLFYDPKSYPSLTSKLYAPIFAMERNSPPSDPGEEVFFKRGMKFLIFAWVGN